MGGVSDYRMPFAQMIERGGLDMPALQPPPPTPRDNIFMLYALTETARAIQYLDDVVRLCEVREVIQEGIERRENQKVFEALRLALHFTANVSKVFWAAGGGKPDRARLRARRLRAFARLPAKHALANRSLRNDIEHFDERLDAWTEVPRNWWAFELVLHEPHMADHMYGVCITYDPRVQAVSVFGRSYDMPTLRLAVVEVQEAISAALERQREEARNRGVERIVDERVR